MRTRSSVERKLLAAERAVARYRAAVEEMMAARFDLELTAAHLNRTGVSPDQARHCETIARELRWRLMPFRVIEPRHYSSVEERLQVEYERRDAFNAQKHEAKLRKRNGNGNGG